MNYRDRWQNNPYQQKRSYKFTVLRKSTILKDLNHAVELIQSGRIAQGGAQIKMLHDWIRDDTYTGLDDD